jgi:hypothetical protein
MTIEQKKWTKAHGWSSDPARDALRDAQLVLVFGATEALKEKGLINAIRGGYSEAHLLGCSTAGEISGTHVSDDSVVITAVRFEHTQLRGAQVKLEDAAHSFAAGEQLAKLLPASLASSDPNKHDLLAHVLVLSDGLSVNGSDLVRGLTQHLPPGVTVTGGLAGDGARFSETLVFWDGEPTQRAVTVVGLYGGRLRVGCGSMGGWDSFGPERLITRAKGNVLYELDGHSALGLYKKYLGDHAGDLPAAGLLFPLSLRTKAGEEGVVRTILAVDEHEQSMTFAGDMPVGAYARLMKANFDRLIDGAMGAAQTGHRVLNSVSPDLAILISCVGRKLVLKQRVEEEVEGVRDVLGGRTVLTGFYSYGEISPFTPGAKCELHNQTMTITTLTEE